MYFSACSSFIAVFALRLDLVSYIFCLPRIARFSLCHTFKRIEKFIGRNNFWRALLAIQASKRLLRNPRCGDQKTYKILRNTERETCLVTPRRKAKDSNEKESVKKQKTVNVFFSLHSISWKQKMFSFSLSSKKKPAEKWRKYSWTKEDGNWSLVGEALADVTKRNVRIGLHFKYEVKAWHPRWWQKRRQLRFFSRKFFPAASQNST